MKHLIEDTPLLMTDELSLDEAIKQIAKNGNGFLALVNDECRLVGILTDADIRRAVLKKEFDLRKVMNVRPKVLPVDSSPQKIINILKKSRRRHMPLVGSCGSYKGVFSLDEVEFNTKSNWVVIMAGGLGSRMGELTKNTPKPMLKVGDKPVLQHIIDNFVDSGFVNFLISVNYKMEVIKDHFGDGSDQGINIRYLEENRRLGTAGALSLIDFEIDEPFIVTNGDVLTHIDHDELLNNHVDTASVATMCVREYCYKAQYGVVDFNDDFDILNIREKPNYVSHINAGVYMLSPEALTCVPNDTLFDMTMLFERVIASSMPVKAFVIEDYWIDIGLREQYEQAKRDFK